MCLVDNGPVEVVASIMGTGPGGAAGMDVEKNDLDPTPVPPTTDSSVSSGRKKSERRMAKGAKLGCKRVPVERGIIENFLIKMNMLKETDDGIRHGRKRGLGVEDNNRDGAKKIKSCTTVGSTSTGRAKSLTQTRQRWPKSKSLKNMSSSKGIKLNGSVINDYFKPIKRDEDESHLGI